MVMVRPLEGLQHTENAVFEGDNDYHDAKNKKKIDLERHFQKNIVSRYRVLAFRVKKTFLIAF